MASPDAVSTFLPRPVGIRWLSDTQGTAIPQALCWLRGSRYSLSGELLTGREIRDATNYSVRTGMRTELGNQASTMKDVET